MNLRSLRPRLANFLWRGDDPVDTSVLEAREHPRERLEELSGHFALHLEAGQEQQLLARDRLGVNKLFFAIEAGEVVSSNYFYELRQRGHAWESIWSIPSSHFALIDPGRRTLRLEKYAPLSFNETASESPPAIEPYAASIRASFERAFERLALALAGRKVYVTLSGGLDSSTIAVLARQSLGDFTAVTFAIGDGDSPPKSEDFATAERLAGDIGVAFEPVVVAPDEVVDCLDDVLIYGQDWRDFNVHCGLVNACIGRAIGRKAAASSEHARPVLLTGDTMNELLADYRPETYNGQEFYRLPRVAPARLRRSLVNGLDSGDREVGLFGHYGVDTLQPFALCADALTDLPPEHVNSERAKQAIMWEVMGDSIPDYVYRRPKTRAQSASADQGGGTLSLLADRGVDAQWLAARFGQLFDIDVDDLRHLIRGGGYRSTKTFPE